MREKDKKPLQVALYGMDGRSQKTMVMFLQGPCKNAAVVVEPVDADIDIIDADYPTAKEILDERRKSGERPIVLMSLEEIRLENTVYLRKPVDTEGMLAALEQAKKLLIKQYSPKKAEDNRVSPDAEEETSKILEKSQQVQSKRDLNEVSSKSANEDEREKNAKHQTSGEYNERGFSAYIGIVPDIDFDDKEQALRASYNAKSYLQGYVKSAFKVAHEKGRSVQLNTGWKPLLIFPQSHEVWLDADDKQLRAFAGVKINHKDKIGMSLSAIDVKAKPTGDALDKFFCMDAFIWKLAIWTSKGRYPSNLDVNRPVYLKRWPNMTRLVVTPHALRIAALLIREPRLMMNIAEVLNIKPQYVFVFISACHAQNLLGQAVRQADQLVVPAEIKSSQSSGLFRKILSKLRTIKTTE